jgi:cell division protein FtsL
MKKPVLFIVTMILTIIGLSIVHVAVANNISTTGVNLSKLQDELDTYKRENAFLHEKILELSSLTYINEKAEQSGFIASKGDYYFSTPLPLAQR